MAGTKVQTSKVWKCPIFPDLARFSGKPGFEARSKQRRSGAQQFIEPLTLVAAIRMNFRTTFHTLNPAISFRRRLDLQILLRS